MTLRTKIYIAAGAFAILILIIGISNLWSDHKVAKFERELEVARSAAAQSETRARELEQLAAGYLRKIEYLEGSLSALRLTATKQDEELKTLNNNTNNARRDVDRTRALRSLESTTAELCQRLADLGHPCE